MSASHSRWLRLFRADARRLAASLLFDIGRPTDNSICISHSASLTRSDGATRMSSTAWRRREKPRLPPSTSERWAPLPFHSVSSLARADFSPHFRLAGRQREGPRNGNQLVGSLEAQRGARQARLLGASHHRLRCRVFFHAFRLCVSYGKGGPEELVPTSSPKPRMRSDRLRAGD